ncbi:hypothetical protein [Sorangium cellulosum]|uniref:hypothetical protein n=1 Tax=Sorangium cellulosum TaxID=56 RepID=UPI00133140AF|nr:hypothetical protein [Sorangium cellulosum]
MNDPERSHHDSDQGPGGAEMDRAPLGLLFLAAAFALALLLTAVGLLAFAAMTPRSPSPPELRGAAAVPQVAGWRPGSATSPQQPTRLDSAAG